MSDAHSAYSHIVMAHGSGGRQMQRLLNDFIFKALKPVLHNAEHDAALLPLLHKEKKLAMTTDSFVVNPLFFPGGNIGHLAVYGSVNDLAMSGAVTDYLSLSLILEEGFALSDFWKILSSIREAALQVDVKIVTGDTKVVEHGKGDGIYINTCAIGCVNNQHELHPSRIQVGDALIVSGDIGRHAATIMSQREGIQLETPLRSDCAPLQSDIQSLLEKNISLHCARDITRGGLASVLHELATQANITFALDEQGLPINNVVQAVCEVLGLDPLYCASEGRMVLCVKAEEIDKTLSVLNASPLAQRNRFKAQHIGWVEKHQKYPVYLKNTYGATRVVDLLNGEQLPRIC